jgi:hypothetical protein
MMSIYYLTAADYKNMFIPDLPSEEQRAATLDFWKFALHGG